MEPQNLQYWYDIVTTCLPCVSVFLSWSGPGPGCSKYVCFPLAIQGLSNLLMFILTFDQEFDFPIMQGLIKSVLLEIVSQ